MIQHIITYGDAYLTKDLYDLINLLYAIWQGIDSQKSKVKASVLQHCFKASQVKIHRPFLPEVLQPEDYALNDIQKVENNILNYIQVIYLGFHLSQSVQQTKFICLANETIEDPISDIENEILATYLRNEANEPEADISVAIPLLVMPLAAVAHIEGLPLFSLQVEPTANINKLQEDLKYKKKYMETLEIQHRYQHIQYRIIDFLITSRATSFSPSSYSTS